MSSATPESLAQEIEQQSALLNDLRKQQGADPALVEDTKKRLGDLKKNLALLKGGAGGKAEKKKERILLKTRKVRTSRAHPAVPLKLIAKNPSLSLCPRPAWCV